MFDAPSLFWVKLDQRNFNYQNMIPSTQEAFWPATGYNHQLPLPRDPGSPSQNGFMEPKYLDKEVMENTPIIIWQGAYSAISAHEIIFSLYELSVP